MLGLDSCDNGKRNRKLFSFALRWILFALLFAAEALMSHALDSSAKCLAEKSSTRLFLSCTNYNLHINLISRLNVFSTTYISYISSCIILQFNDFVSFLSS